VNRVCNRLEPLGHVIEGWECDGLRDLLEASNARPARLDARKDETTSRMSDHSLKISNTELIPVSLLTFASVRVGNVERRSLSAGTRVHRDGLQTGDGSPLTINLMNTARIWVMDRAGRNANAVASGASDNAVPSWTRDGNAILFASNRTGQYEVWAHDLETGRESRITTKGGFASFESPDRKSVLYTKVDGAGIWTVPRNGGSETRLTAAPHLGYWGDFAVTDEGIISSIRMRPTGRRLSTMPSRPRRSRRFHVCKGSVSHSVGRKPWRVARWPHDLFRRGNDEELHCDG